MNSQDPNFWIAFALFGVPLIVAFGGPMGWRMLVLLGALAGLAYAPLISVMVLVLYVLWTPIRWFLEAFLFGLAGGLGARLSGALSGAERAERQRERWEDRHRSRR